MSSSAKNIINETLKQGYVYYFVEKSFGVDEPHYFVILNKSPSDDVFIAFINSTSKVIETVKRVKYLKQVPETCVSVEIGECTFLKKRSAFNCNSVIKKSKEILITKVQNNEIKFKGMLPESIIQKLLTGVMKSRIVEMDIKEVICPAP